MKSTESNLTIQTAVVKFSNEYLAFQLADELKDETMSLNIEYQVSGTTCKIGNPKYELIDAFNRIYLSYTQTKDTHPNASMHDKEFLMGDDKTETPIIPQQDQDIRKINKQGQKVLDGWYFDEDTVDYMSELCQFLVGVPFGFNEQMIDQNFRTQKITQPKNVIFNQKENPHICRLEFEETGVQERLNKLDFTLQYPHICEYKPVIILPINSKKTIPEIEQKEHQCILTGVIPDWDQEMLVHKLEEYMGDRIVELNPSISPDQIVVLFKHKRTVEQVKTIREGKIKVFGRNLTIKPFTEQPVVLTGEYFPVKVKYLEGNGEMQDKGDFLSVIEGEQNPDQFIKWNVNKFEFEKMVFPFTQIPQGRPVDSKNIRVLAGEIDEPELLVKLFRKGVIDPCTGQAYFDATIAAANGIQLDENGRAHIDKPHLSVYCQFKFFKLKKEIKPETKKSKSQLRMENRQKLMGLKSSEQFIDIDTGEGQYSNYTKNWMRSIKMQIDV